MADNTKQPRIRFNPRTVFDIDSIELPTSQKNIIEHQANNHAMLN
jgi:hypothetical protein